MVRQEEQFDFTMTPAPGPVSPPPGDDQAGSSTSLDTILQPANSLPRNRSRERALERARNGEQTSDQNNPTPLNAPKACARCGRLLESGDQNEASTSSPDQASLIATTAPSPSSIAFVTESSAIRMGNDPSETTMNAIRRQAEVPSTDQDGNQICTLCAAHVASIDELNTGQETSIAPIHHTISSQTSTHDIHTASSVQSRDRDGDMAMGEEDNTSNGGVQPSHTTYDSPNRSAVHPWRTLAPWANIRRQRSSSNNASTGEGPPLTISVGDMGAGGDAMNAVQEDDSVDFPPLARSPNSNSQMAMATSPRLPLSPQRGRTTSNGGMAVSPPPLGRQSSFSRSQSGGVSGANNMTSGSVPVVNLTNRGRHRATSNSSGSGTISGPNGTVGRGRRPSATRRLSRSSSSQGPTAVSFAGLGEIPSGSALNDDVLGVIIAEDPIGPSSMTRPRISTLEKTRNGKSSQKSSQNGIILPDVYRKPFMVEDRIGSNDIENHNDDLQKARYLIWLNTRQADPRPQISSRRCLSQGRGCLFSGATFRGTQKSGRMSYDVSVQIVNVDLAASHLCGYLNIRGLTDDWPELTTYFDAEIIGQRYGFLTNKWGATEADDLKHWSRFTPFRPIRSTLTRPGLRFNHMNKPFIFMRWKERFLVPDHRVRDISGASFAGFYYVCVELGDDLNQIPSQSLTSPASPLSSPGACPPLRSPTLGPSSVMEGILDTNSAIPQPLSPTGEAMPAHLYTAADRHTTATSGRMSGFYFHEHSEPYQQLTLRHVSESSTSSFELR